MTEYSDFKEVNDPKLRAMNRGTIMANIYQDHENKSQILSQKGAAILFRYFNDIPSDEKLEAYKYFQETMLERGYTQATKH